MGKKRVGAWNGPVRRITVPLPAPLAEGLEQRAEEQRRSIAQQIVWELESLQRPPVSATVAESPALAGLTDEERERFQQQAQGQGQQPEDAIAALIRQYLDRQGRLF